jgi:hypothetical protein
MNFEVGKEYVDGNNSVVKIIYIYGEDSTFYPIIGVNEGLDATAELPRYTRDGKFVANDSHSRKDLIGPKPKFKTGETWVMRDETEALIVSVNDNAIIVVVEQNRFDHDCFIMNSDGYYYNVFEPNPRDLISKI